MEQRESERVREESRRAARPAGSPVITGGPSRLAGKEVAAETRGGKQREREQSSSARPASRPCVYGFQCPVVMQCQQREKQRKRERESRDRESKKHR